MQSSAWNEIEEHWAASFRPSQAIVACPNCGIDHGVEIVYDGDQGYAFLATIPCSVCHRDLCPSCPRLRCECGKIVCFACSAIMPDGTASGLHLCKPCALAADPVCPACGEFAPMQPRNDCEQQWFECTACGAALSQEEIDAAQRAAIPRHSILEALSGRHSRKFADVA